MNQQREPQPSKAELAVQYLAEVANTYAQTLDNVARAPFVNHVNQCIRAIHEDREELKAALAAGLAPSPEPSPEDE